jgi:hypothetical protein
MMWSTNNWLTCSGLASAKSMVPRRLTQLLSSVEKDNKRLHNEWLQTAINYKVEWDTELERRRQLGIQAPDPVPHPDHVIIDMQTGSVRITRPMTKEEKAVWDAYVGHKADALGEVVELKKLLKTDPNHPGNAEIQKTIDYIESKFELVEAALSDRFGRSSKKRRAR